MSGFFKKLFNRIVGKRDEAPAPQAEPAALPAPEPEPVPEVPASPLVVEAQPETAAPVFEPEPVPEPPAIAEPEKAARKAKSAPQAKARTSPPAPEKPLAKSKAAPPPASKAGSGKAEPIVPTAKKKPETTSRVKTAEAKKAAKAPPPEKPVRKPEAAPVIPPKIELAPEREKIAAKAPEPPQPAPPAPIVSEIESEPLQPVAAPVAAPVPVQDSVIAAEEPQRKGLFARLREGLSKSSNSITRSISAIFTKRKLDTATLQELEDILIQADLGLTVSERIIAEVRRGRYDKEIDPQEVKQILASEVAKVLKPVEVPFNFGAEKPFVILVVGVNGSGKTTTIGKLGAIAAREGFKVKFAACDTFRAAAIEQLTVWGRRIGVETVSRPPGSDAAGLAFDAMKAARDDGTDILFVDTAGRLHNKAYLMDELDKVVRVIKKYDAAAPHAVLLVLDATTGQNALAQADAFTKVAGVTGLIMTKLDGTARGGILVAIAEKFKLPIHAIGVGESIDDLQAFEADAFSRAIAGLEDAA